MVDKIDYVVSRLNSIRETDIKDQVIIDRLSRLPNTINTVATGTIPNSTGGNNYFGYLAFSSLIDSINVILDHVNPRDRSWQEIEKNKLVPNALKRRLEDLSRQIVILEQQNSSIVSKFEIIERARATAESLPEMLNTLDEARVKYDSAEKHLQRISNSIEQAGKTVSGYKDKVELTLTKVIESASEVEGIKDAATRQGLGKSFDDRAKNLRISTYVLMALLALCLYLAADIAHDRIAYVEKILDRPNLNLQIIWANVLLTGFGVGAPIWFAWLLTRQIGQRFRLAEDYGFKASVAKAYEGYRRESQEVGDEELQKRLLGIALDKVEQAPLSHIEKEESSSPLHDFISSWRKRSDDGNSGPGD